VKKDVNPRWQPRNGCDGRFIAKILITTIQANLCCLLHVSQGFGTKFTLLTYHHSHLLAASLNFTPFFTMAFLGAAHFYYSFAVYGLDFTSFCMLQSWHIAINGCCYLFFLFPSM